SPLGCACVRGRRRRYGHGGRRGRRRAHRGPARPRDRHGSRGSTGPRGGRPGRRRGWLRASGSRAHRSRPRRAMSLGLVVSRNRTAILGLTALLAAAGLLAARRMPLASFPRVAFHRIALIAHAGHLPVAQTLTTVTQPLAAALTTVPG